MYVVLISETVKPLIFKISETVNFLSDIRFLSQLIGLHEKHDALRFFYTMHKSSHLLLYLNIKIDFSRKLTILLKTFRTFYTILAVIWRNVGLDNVDFV